MDEAISLFKAVFDILQNSVFGMPLIYWLVIPLFFTLIGLFVKGKKE